MNRARLIGGIGVFVGIVAFAYFALIASQPGSLARVLLRRGYEARGWTEARLSVRLRLVGIAGATVALAAILLAIVKFVG